MRVGVIRGDLSQGIFIGDLEPTSQVDPVIEHGQTQYIGRPDPVALQKYLTAQGFSTTAATVITATLPVGGPLNVSSSHILAIAGLSGATGTQVASIANLIAPQFVETDVAQKSYLRGNLHGLLSSSFSPDPNRLVTGAAISVVEDDGVTAFSSQVAAPAITSCHISGGNLQINGTNLALYANYTLTKSLTVNITGAGAVRLNQRQIELAVGSSFTATQIVVPAALVPHIAIGSVVTLKVNGMVAGPTAIS